MMLWAIQIFAIAFGAAGTMKLVGSKAQLAAKSAHGVGLCAGVRDGQGQGGAKAAHPNLRDKAPGTELSKATIAGAIIGFSISLAAGIVFVVQMSWWLSSWAMVLRRLLGYP